MTVNIQKFFRSCTFITFCLASLSFTGFSAFADTAAQQKPVSIDADADILTMINVLTPEPGKQLETIQLLQRGMQITMRNQPGFISANIHRSLDNEHVIVYAQWEDQASVDAAAKLIQNGEAPNMAAVFTIASPAFHPYEVVSVHTGATPE